jgi:long-subunit fatty acid transport protein
MKKSNLAAGLLLAAASTVGAQTNDRNFRSFQWVEDIGAARAAGMGGAFVALADDGSASFLNPAGLGQIRKGEVSAGLTLRKSGTLRAGDTTESQAGIGYIGGVRALTKDLAVGVFVTQPQEERILLAINPVDRVDSGFLDTSITEYGGAVSWSPEKRLFLGARLNLSHLSLGGLLNHQLGRGGSILVTMNGSQTKLTGQVGLLGKLSDGANIGVAYTQGVRWDVDRASTAIPSGPLPSAPFQLSSPSRLSGGVSYRPTRLVTVAGQVDYVLYSRLHETLQIVSLPVVASDYRLDNGVDLRAGVEWRFPRRSFTWSARGGIYSQAPSSFQFIALAPSQEAASFVGMGRQTMGTLGGSIESKRGVRLDVAGAFGGIRSVLLAGVTVKP